MLAGWPVQLTTKTLNRLLCQYASSPGNSSTKLAVSPLTVAVIIASTH